MELTIRRLLGGKSLGHLEREPPGKFLPLSFEK